MFVSGGDSRNVLHKMVRGVYLRYMETQQEKAVFGGGCFWCTEAVLQQLKGVEKVTPGYAGGTTENPTYEDVCSGTTGHAEVIEITFDPQVISYKQLLAVFFSSHNPTTLNKQGNDEGTQYRSIILYTSPEQQQEAESYITMLTNDHTFEDPIVTTVEPFKIFYPAEEYHQNYYKNNESKPYCQAIINPKVAKIREQYADLLKNS